MNRRRAERPAVRFAQSLDGLSMLIGARTVEVVKIAGADVAVAFNPEPPPNAEINTWATAVLGREIRGEVVALVVKP